MADERAEAANEVSSGSMGGGASPSGGGSKIVAIASVVNVIATLGIIALLFMAHQKEKARPSVDDIVSGQMKAKQGGEKSKDEKGGEKGEKGGGEETLTDSGKIIPLEPFLVNLSTGIGTSPKYVRLNVSIELEQGVSDQEFAVKVPRVRDTVINLLNSRHAGEISAPDGRELLKEEIKKSVNSFMIQSKVKGVYFTNFAVSQ